MTTPALHPLIRTFVRRLVPSRWRESVYGDVCEERARRLAAGRSAGGMWQLHAVLGIAFAIAVHDIGARLSEMARGRRRGILDVLGSDIRQAVRGLLKSRLYSSLALATLALGIGANAAVFNVANWVLFRPLPGVRTPSDLVPIQLAPATAGGRQPISDAEIDAIAAGTPALEGLAGFDTLDTANVATPNGIATRLSAEAVTSNYFDVLGVPVVAGRAFTPEEGRYPAGPSVSLLSERVARRLFGRADAAIAQTVQVNGQPVLVVGVVIRGFHGTKLLGSVDLWMPGALRHILLPAGYPKGAADSTRTRGLYFTLAGRLKAGHARDALSGQLQAVERELIAMHPSSAARFKDRHLRTTSSFDMYQQPRADLRETFMMLVGLAAVLLAMACASVSNAVLARAMSRGGEIATRLAIGASRMAIARLFFIENLSLCLASGAMALGLAWLVGALLENTIFWTGLPPLDRAVPDWRVVAAGLGLSAAAAAVVSALPLWSVRRTDISSLLHGSTRTTSLTRRRGRSLLMSVEVAASFVLLVCALLLTRSMAARLAINPGFDTARVLSFSVSPNPSPTRPNRVLHTDLVSAVRRIPGVRAAALSFLPPFHTGTEGRLLFHTDHHADELAAALNAVQAGFFDTIGVPFVAGRDFTESEVASAAPMADAPIILVESLAQRAFGRVDVAGEHIVTRQGPRRQVVGIVRDTRQRRLTDPGSADMAFQPYRASYRSPWVSVLVAESTPGLVREDALRRAVSSVDPALPLFDLTRAQAGIERQFEREILASRLAAAFAAFAVIAAAAGLYGLISRTVAERRREIGVRRALGARSSSIAQLITRDLAWPVAAGLAAGGLVSVWSSRLLAAELYGVSPFDAFAYLGAGVTILAALASSCAPACVRAVRLDPARALRD